MPVIISGTIKQNKMNTTEKMNLIDKIKIEIEDMQCDISNELHRPEEITRIKLDLDSLKTILGHLMTLKTF